MAAANQSRVVRMPMAIEHDPRSTEGVRDDAIGARVGIATLDLEHLLRLREIPGLAAVALLEPREHQLRTHGAVAEEWFVLEGVQQRFLHCVCNSRIGDVSSCRVSRWTSA